MDQHVSIHIQSTWTFCDASACLFAQDELLPVIWEALGGTEDIPVVTVGLLLALVCQADFDDKAAFVFWLLDK